MIPQSDWKWIGTAECYDSELYEYDDFHFILHTHIGKYCINTVGSYCVNSVSAPKKYRGVLNTDSSCLTVVIDMDYRRKTEGGFFVPAPKKVVKKRTKDFEEAAKLHMEMCNKYAEMQNLRYTKV